MRDIKLQDRCYVLPQGETGTVSHISDDKMSITVECDSGFRWFGRPEFLVVDSDITSTPNV